MHISFNLYKPSQVEGWISNIYQQHGIMQPQDLTVSAVSEIFSIKVIKHEGPVFAEWEDGLYSFIFLNQNKSAEEQKNDFFHELCHPLRHVGKQDQLPKLFQELQEMQAAQFQLVAAMPIYLIEQVPYTRYWEQYISTLAHYFSLPKYFVDRRMQQINRKIECEFYWKCI